jgi:hypothetical protein
MAVQVMITLPDNVYQRAERLARLTGRKVADVVAGIVESSVSSENMPSITPTALGSLPDSEVLALVELQMDARQDRRMSDLLYQQQARDLTETENHELQALMRVYQEGLLRKAQAMHEAVRRGLLKQ